MIVYGTVFKVIVFVTMFKVIVLAPGGGAVQDLWLRGVLNIMDPVIKLLSGPGQQVLYIYFFETG